MRTSLGRVFQLDTLLAVYRLEMENDKKKADEHHTFPSK